jgi:hypothetical protein
MDFEETLLQKVSTSKGCYPIFATLHFSLKDSLENYN